MHLPLVFSLDWTGPKQRVSGDMLGIRGTDRSCRASEHAVMEVGWGEQSDRVVKEQRNFLLKGLGTGD